MRSSSAKADVAKKGFRSTAISLAIIFCGLVFVLRGGAPALLMAARFLLPLIVLVFVYYSLRRWWRGELGGGKTVLRDENAMKRLCPACGSYLEKSGVCRRPSCTAHR